MFRYMLFAILTAWSLMLWAQTSDVPGMHSDMSDAEPPPRVEGEPPPAPAQPPQQTAGDNAETDSDGVPRPPVLPEPMESGETIEPQVRIIQKEGATVEEYSINGRTYMVKVTPTKGPPYYLIDQDGDGSLETRRSGIYEDPIVPQWVIFSW